MFLKSLFLAVAGAVIALPAIANPLSGMELPDAVLNAPSQSRWPDYDYTLAIKAARLMLSHRDATWCFKRVQVPGTSKKPRFTKELDFKTLLVVFSPGFIHTVEISKDNPKSDEFVITRGKKNGINTPWTVEKPDENDGYGIIATKRVVHVGSGYGEAIYTPYSADIDTPLMRMKGFGRLRNTLEKAYTALYNERQVRSHAFPGKSVGDVVPLDTALVLTLNEHIDPADVGDTPTENLINKVFVTIGANEDAAYTHARSDAGARGLAQFIPKTYAGIRRQYPEAKLKANFIAAMNDPVNAAKAQQLLFDSDLAQLPKEMRRRLVDPSTPRQELADYLAASYNAGAPRVVACLVQGRLLATCVPTETKKYLEKEAAVSNALNL